jgi:hypothetical protein
MGLSSVRELLEESCQAESKVTKMVHTKALRQEGLFGGTNKQKKAHVVRGILGRDEAGRGVRSQILQDLYLLLQGTGFGKVQKGSVEGS